MCSLEHGVMSREVRLLPRFPGVPVLPWRPSTGHTRSATRFVFGSCSSPSPAAAQFPGAAAAQLCRMTAAKRSTGSAACYSQDALCPTLDRDWIGSEFCRGIIEENKYVRKHSLACVKHEGISRSYSASPIHRCSNGSPVSLKAPL